MLLLLLDLCLISVRIHRRNLPILVDLWSHKVRKFVPLEALHINVDLLVDQEFVILCMVGSLWVLNELLELAEEPFSGIGEINLWMHLPHVLQILHSNPKIIGIVHLESLVFFIA